MRIVRRAGGVRAASWRWAAVLAVGAAAVVPAGAPRAASDVVARVNGEPVDRAELERARANPLTLRQLQLEHGTRDPGPEALDRLALRKVIHRRLLVQEARRRNLTIGEKELDDAVTALRGRFGSLKEFGAWMKEQGLADATLFDFVRDDLAASRAWQALLDEVRVTDEEVRRYYAAHERELSREEVRLQIIAVADEASAESIMDALRRGEDFGRLARQRSVGRLAARGGDTGWIATDTLQPPLLQAVATMKTGMARGPLRRGSEVLVVRLDGWRIHTRSLAEVRPEIERRLAQPAGRQEVAEAWLKAREASAKVEVVGPVAARRE